jgi:Na+/melibiose symporter-like transporter
MNDSGDGSGSARMFLLPGLFLCVFGILVMVLMQMVPGPLKELDYMVIGTVSVMLGLLVVFFVAARTAKSGDLFFRPPTPGRRKAKPRRSGTSILDLNEPVDQDSTKES